MAQGVERKDFSAVPHFAVGDFEDEDLFFFEDDAPGRNVVFRGRDRFLNQMNDPGRVKGIDLPIDREGLELLSSESPYGECQEIGHKAVLTEKSLEPEEDPKDMRKWRMYLNDEKTGRGLDYHPEGELYDLTFQEELYHPSEGRITGNNTEKLDEDVEVLYVHTSVYVDESGGIYMTHSDPQLRGNDGKGKTKKKFLDQAGEPDVPEGPVALHRKHEFEDRGENVFYMNNSVRSFEEGLEQLVERLDAIGRNYYREAEKALSRDSGNGEIVESSRVAGAGRGLERLLRKYGENGPDLEQSEEALELIWEGMRYSSMADSIQKFREKYREAYGPV